MPMKIPIDDPLDEPPLLATVCVGAAGSDTWVPGTGGTSACAGSMAMLTVSPLTLVDWVQLVPFQ